MAKPSEFDNQENPIKGSREVTSQQDSSIDYTTKNPSENYFPPEPTVNYGLGATGSVSTAGKPTGGGAAPFLHPFKLERVTDPDDTSSTKVRVYEGDVYAKIDTFQLDLLSITTSVESYHPSNLTDATDGPFTEEQSLGNHTITFSDVTATMPQHQHDVDGGAVYIPQHKHLARDSTEDGLVMPNHKHAAETTGDSAMEAQAGNTSADTGLAGSHSHDAGTYRLPEHQHAGYDSTDTSKQLTMPDHKHDQDGTAAVGNDNSGVTSSNGGHSHTAGTYEIPDHKHDQDGTAEAKDDGSAGAITTGTTIQTTDTEHTHSVSGLSATVADHYHASGGTGAGSGQQLTIKQHKHLPRNGTEDGLVMPNHKHAAETTGSSAMEAQAGNTTANTGLAGSHSHGAGSYEMPDHQHDQGGTAEAKTGNDITEGTTIQTSDTSHTHGSGGYAIPDHSHKASDSSNSLTIPQHTHLPRNSSGDGLVMPDHEHEAGTDSGNLKIPQHQHEIGISGNTGSVVGSGGTYPCDDTGHYHQVYINQQTTNIVSTNDRSVEGETDGVKGHSTNSSKRRITGNTGDVDTSSSSALIVEGDTGGLSTSTSTAVTGTSGSESSHSHKYKKDDHSHTLDGQTGDVYNYSVSSQKAITGVSETQAAHQHEYIKDDHSHTVTGDTTEVTDYNSTDGGERKVIGNTGNIVNFESTGNPEHVEGNTGGIATAAPSSSISGTLGDESSHSHKYNKDDHSHNLIGETAGINTTVSGSSIGLLGSSSAVSDHNHTFTKNDHTHDLTGETGLVHNHSTAANKQIAGNTADVVPQSGVLPLITGTSSTVANHQHSYIKDNHVHSVTGDTTEVTDYSATDGAERKVTGETGSIKDYSTESNKKCTGTTGNVKVGSSTDLPDFTISISGNSTSSGLDHKHRVPALQSTTTTHNFVAVAGQERPDPLTPPSTTWTNVFNKYVILDDGSNSLFRYHETNHSDGDFYVKWVITIDGEAKVQSVVGSIHREAAGAGRPDDDPFGALEQSNTGALTRGKNTGTFYQKIGTVSGGVVQQKQFSNINWSMTVLPTVS